MRPTPALLVAALLSVQAASLQAELPLTPILAFRVRQLPMTGVPWAGPIGALAANPAAGTGDVLAASWSGGLFRSIDGGGHWTHVDAFAPTDLSSVVWAPTFALGTAFVSTRDDFRSETRGTNTSGVWRSRDGGVTWSQVLRLRSTNPYPGAACDSRPMAYGMSADPIGRRLFVATKCGIWRTLDGSGFVRYRETASSSNTSLNRYYDVQVLLSGDVVALGEAGLSYLASGATAFAPAASVPGGLSFGSLGSDGNYRGAFSAAPRGNLNAFAVVESASGLPALLYSPDGGRNWQSAQVPADPNYSGGCGGSPFVRVLPVSPADQDHAYIFYSDGCWVFMTGPLNVPTGNFAPLLPGLTWTRINQTHMDPHDLILWGTQLRVAGDGGIEVCATSGACSATVGPAQGLNALQMIGVAGQQIMDFSHLFASPEHHLYASTWHTYLWGSPDGETWEKGDEAEGIELEIARTTPDTSTAQLAYDRYAFTCLTCQYRLSGDLFTAAQDFPLAPDTLRPAFLVPPGGEVYAQTTSSANPPEVWVSPQVRLGSGGAGWTRIAPVQDCGPGGAGPCVGLMVPTDAQFGAFMQSRNRNPALYATVVGQRTGPDNRTIVQSNTGLAFLSDFLFVDAGGEVVLSPSEVLYPRMSRAGGQVTLGFNPAGGVRRAVFAVDPGFAGHILAADVSSRQMVESFDGGDIWWPLPALTNLITGYGRLVFTVVNAPGFATETWPLVSAISFFPENPEQIIIGTMNTGLFYTADSGRHWRHIPGSTQIPAITEFHWRSANSVIVASAGRGLWEVQIDLREPLLRLPSACPDCSVFRLTLAPARRDPSVLVAGGRVNGIEFGQDGLVTVGVTPGSSHLWFGNAKDRPMLDVVERSQAAGFASLPQAGELIKQGFTIRGLSIRGGKLTGILYGEGDAVVPAPAFKELTKAPGLPTLHLNDKPYLTFRGEQLRGLSIPRGATLTVAGQNFTIDQSQPVAVFVDDQVAAKSVQVGQAGAFEVSFEVTVGQGFHSIVVTQGQRRLVMALNVTHADAGEGQ